MKKTLEQQYKEETGLNAYEPNNMRPNIPEDVYVEWLEKQLLLCGVAKQSEKQKALEDLIDFAYDNCELHNSDRLEDIMKRL